MKQRKIYITENDRKRLSELIELAASPAQEDGEDLRDLRIELESAVVVKPEKVPPDVVTMNSVVGLRDLGSGKDKVFKLVFPYDADSSQNRISVLAPIGVAILGYRVGAEIDVHVPAGKRRIKITKMEYQPEAAGRYES